MDPQGQLWEIGTSGGKKKSFSLTQEKCPVSQEGMSVPWSELVFIAEHFALLSFNCMLLLLLLSCFSRVQFCVTP